MNSVIIGLYSDVLRAHIMERSSSITVSFKKKQAVTDVKDEVGEVGTTIANTANKAEPLDPTANESIIETKADLLDLYHNEPLPLNNSVNSAELLKVNTQRVALYHRQLERTKLLYTLAPSLRPTYLVQALKTQFIEFQHYQIVQALNQRAIADLTSINTLWQQVHIIDDLIVDIVRMMPAQKPVGWQLTSVNKNHLKLPTVGRLRDNESIADQASINSYVLGHFGVMSYTYDRAYFIGHVLGYLFCCYYLAHLSLSYGVTPLPEKAVIGYDYASLETIKMVRLLHSIDVHCKRRIYQLAVLCARLSSYKLDKHVEKMLITEVNEFDKKQQIAHLDALLYQGLMPDMPTIIDDD